MTDLRIALIGAGNLAWNLAAALEESPHQIVQVFSRHAESAKRIAEEFSGITPCAHPSELDKTVDIVIIASSDHGIAGIAETYAPFAGPKSVFAHTSGSISLAALAPFGKNIGVFYPMQTFTKGHRANFAEIPFFLEGSDDVIAKLRPLAAFLSWRVSIMDSGNRLRLHLGAVFASNFSNFMWLMAEDAALDAGLDGLSVYAPLIKECMEKALRYGPKAAQTGPARRGDHITMQKHVDMLAEKDALQAELYQHLSELIEKRLRED